MSPLPRRPTSKRTTLLKLAIHAQTGSQYVPYLSRHLIAAHRLLRYPPVSPSPGPPLVSARSGGGLLSHPLHELSIAIVNAQTMTRLHADCLNLNTPTDVLTFELDHNRDGKPISGEVVICLTVARQCASAAKRPVREELLLYALHGMLHLSGFDDRTRKGHKAMHAKEDEILIRLGIGPVFQNAPRPTAKSSPKSKTRPGAG